MKEVKFSHFTNGCHLSFNQSKIDSFGSTDQLVLNI